LAELRSGQRIGPYEVRGLLGKGGAGAVYLAEEPSLERRVAVKTLPAHLADDADVVARFQREARALAQLRHPNLVHIYTVGEHEGRPYFAMEYVRGYTLRSVVKNAGRFPPERAIHITAQVLSALDKVHGAGIVHRDVKSGNIIIDEDGRAVLMDFGLARREQDARLTADHTVLGTPEYMSPEQAKGAAVDTRADLYSLGIVLYEMLTGSPPFRGKSAFEVLRQHIEASVPAPSAAAPGGSPELDAVVARAVAKAPEDRYPSARDMGTALSEVHPDPALAGLLEGAETEPTVRTALSRPDLASTVTLNAAGRRRRRLRIAAAILLAALTGLIMVLAWPRLEPLPAPGRRVEILRRGAEPVRGTLMAIEFLDDSTTTAKISGESGDRTISIREGDVLRVLPER